MEQLADILDLFEKTLLSDLHHPPCNKCYSLGVDLEQSCLRQSQV